MDIVLEGTGASLRECRNLLLRAGFEVGSNLEQNERCPVILGDTPHLFSTALQLVTGRRHLLVANPSGLSAAQLTSLLSSRRPRQALYLWSERRQHPAYKMVSKLATADDSGWRPRYVRETAFKTERPSAAALRWLACESLAIAVELAACEPQRLSAFGSMNTGRGSLDQLFITLDFDGVEGFISVAFGEAEDRSETVLASNERKAYIDELNPNMPLRLVDDLDGRAADSRRVSGAALGPSELAKLQCLAFLEGSTNPAKCQFEADTWLSVMACWQAAETSMASQGAVEVLEPSVPALRVIRGRITREIGATTPLRAG